MNVLLTKVYIELLDKKIPIEIHEKVYWNRNPRQLIVPRNDLGENLKESMFYTALVEYLVHHHLE